MNSFNSAGPDSFDGSTSHRGIEIAHQFFCSLNVAFVITAFIFYGMSAQALGPMLRFNSSLNKLLHIKQTDLLTMYWSFFLTGAALTLFFFTVLRLFSRTAPMREVLRSVAGFLGIGASPCWYIWAIYKGDLYYGHWWALFQHGRNYEFALALMCVLAYAMHWWPVPVAGSTLLIFGHYAFWFWEFRFSFRELLRGWGGSEAVLPVVGLVASLTWILYLAREGLARKSMAAH